MFNVSIVSNLLGSDLIVKQQSVFTADHYAKSKYKMTPNGGM